MKNTSRVRAQATLMIPCKERVWKPNKRVIGGRASEEREAAKSFEDFVRESTESYAQVAEGTAGNRHLNGELGVAKSRQQSGDSCYQVSDHHGRACILVGSSASGHEDASTHHPPDAQRYDVPPMQTPAHLGARPSLHLEEKHGEQRTLSLEL